MSLNRPDDPAAETAAGAGVAAEAGNGLRSELQRADAQGVTAADERVAIGLAAAAKSRRYGAWYVAEHKLRDAKSYLQTIVVTAIGTPLIYLFAFGVGLSVLIDRNAGPGAVEGVSYLQFVAPALMVAAAVTVASEEFTYTVMMGFKWNPTFIAMNAAPLSGAQIMQGLVLFVAIRMVGTVGAFFVLMALFGAAPSGSAVLGVLIGVLTGLGFGLPLLAYSASLKEDRGQFALVGRLIVVPMTLFSGTMFPLSQLPVFLQWIGWISPLWHGSELARLAAYGADVPVWLAIVHVSVLVGLAIVGLSLAIRITTRRLDQ